MNSTNLFGYPPLNGNNFSLNGQQKGADPNAFSFAPYSAVQMPYSLPIKGQDAVPLDFSIPWDANGARRGLQTHLNDMQARLGDLGLAYTKSTADAHQAQFDNPRLSEQAINSHEVEMLSQHIQSLTNQVKKLQDFINPSALSTTSTHSGPPSSDDSSSNTRSTPANKQDEAHAPLYAPGFPYFENYLGDPRRQTVLANAQGPHVNAQSLWFGQDNQAHVTAHDEPRYIPTPAH
jgi:hypothetical protein